MEKIIGIPITLQNKEFQIASFRENSDEAICFYKGDIDKFTDLELIVRIHSGCITSEVFGMENCDCKWQLDNSINLISNSNVGLIIYLPNQEGKGNGIFNKVRSFEMMNCGLSSSASYDLLNLPIDARKYDFAIKILKTIGVKTIKLLTNSPDKVMACIDGGLLISQRIPSIIENPNLAVQSLLIDKRDKFKHYIN